MLLEEPADYLPEVYEIMLTFWAHKSMHPASEQPLMNPSKCSLSFVNARANVDIFQLFLFILASCTPFTMGEFTQHMCTLAQ